MNTVVRVFKRARAGSRDRQPRQAAHTRTLEVITVLDTCVPFRPLPFPRNYLTEATYVRSSLTTKSTDSVHLHF